MHPSKLVLILFLLALMGGSALFLPKTNLERPVDWTDKTEVTILFTENGFAPRAAYITTGTKVVFATALKTSFWPASDLHPSHFIYPALDPRTPISAQGTWSFTFNKEGRWGYHNHMEAIETGVVIVVPVGFKVDKQFNTKPICDQKGEDEKRACWSERLKSALDTKGLSASFDELGRLNKLDPDFSGLCHTFAHNLGLLGYAKYGDNAPLLEKAGYCNDGFWHGFMEGFFTRHHDPTEARVFCKKVERRFKEIYPLAYKQCNHGIGHGGAEYILHTRADLWGDIPRVTAMFIPLCEYVETSSRRACASGAYAVLGDWMHLQERYANTMTSSGLFSLCAQASEMWAREGCAWEFSKRTRWFVKRLPDMFPVIIREGVVIENGRYLSSMIESSAMIIAEKSQHVEDANLADLCRVLPRTLRTSCLVGIVQGLFFSATPGEETRRAVRFCLSGNLVGSERLSCASTLLTLVSISYISKELAEACALFPETLRAEVSVCADTR